MAEEVIKKKRTTSQQLIIFFRIQLDLFWKNKPLLQDWNSLQQTKQKILLRQNKSKRDASIIMVQNCCIFQDFRP